MLYELSSENAEAVPTHCLRILMVIVCKLLWNRYLLV